MSQTYPIIDHVYDVVGAGLAPRKGRGTNRLSPVHTHALTNEIQHIAPEVRIY